MKDVKEVNVLLHPRQVLWQPCKIEGVLSVFLFLPLILKTYEVRKVGTDTSTVRYKFRRKIAAFRYNFQNLSRRHKPIHWQKPFHHSNCSWTCFFFRFFDSDRDQSFSLSGSRWRAFVVEELVPHTGIRTEYHHPPILAHRSAWWSLKQFLMVLGSSPLIFVCVSYGNI